MSPDAESEDDKAVESIRELFNTITTTAGVILAILWGLTQRAEVADFLPAIRLASVVLVVSIVASIIGCQFLVTALANNHQDITKTGGVAYSFLVSWVFFLLGCLVLVYAIWSFTPSQPSPLDVLAPLTEELFVMKEIFLA